MMNQLANRIAGLNIVQFFGTRKAWALPLAYANTALIDSGLLGVDFSAGEAQLAKLITYVGAFALIIFDAYRDHRLGI